MPSPQRERAPHTTVFAAGLAARLALALGAIATLWLCVWWALV
ncbi:MAG: hypothetical protein CVT73_15420 [Alphaproteobacteria bacterium HGW-Alphaproteobacteria-12]|nr:MAG: hypothetical protein CVT73_15420 [Alphaproteobacteria bacterium HGW-Alphaproteobacteria-12]